MPHKLWIYPEVVAPQEYRELLSYFEVVASAPNIVKFILKNIGKDAFPGGEIAKGYVSCETPFGMATYSQRRSVTPQELPPIQPNETFVISLKEWFPTNPGIWMIRVKINPKDNTKIEYYQGPENPMEEDEWYQFFYAVDRHQLNLTLLLKKLLHKWG